MKLTIKLYRVVTVPTEWLNSVVGLGKDAETAKIDAKIREEFYPFAPRFRIFYGTTLTKQASKEALENAVPSEVLEAASKTVIGIEAMSFDVSDFNVPFAGLISADPIDPVDVARIDGALESEMGRMGIATEFEKFEWRTFAEARGN